ncbi:hypothetical protein CHS0354_010131 [Potamilus streckersoni]|uniref:Uncharacterized protein n=1 Tax=Potamilus streckersoni TaxID=2493646 RepID=A0AAE0RSL4_9BIVA|nr:hypothetical protein CHS0354_010131 [Potamilus streckersoni]
MYYSNRILLITTIVLWQDTRADDNIASYPHYDQEKLLIKKWEECMERIHNDPVTTSGSYCNRTWDNLSCWPDTPAGTNAIQPCPSYINGFTTGENATRNCLPNGTWFVNPLYPNQTTGWTDYGACFNISLPDIDLNTGVPGIFKDNIKALSLMYNIGYSLSLVSLVIAVGIMLYFRRLRCNRNIIHVHMFMSFILRAVISLVRDTVMVQGLGFPGDIAFKENGNIYFLETGSHWQCKFFFTIFQYSLSANYIWIFIEGAYLHMLINVAVFSQKHRIIWYIVFGWGFPWLFIIPWALARYFLDNTLCWNTHQGDIIWIIKGPITAAIVINFGFYVNIIRVLFTKLTSTPCPDAKKYRYRRLAKSVLVLIPAFGAYYIVFVCITYLPPRLDDIAMIAILYSEMFFNSYGGFIIALLFCFLNSEVRYEIKKAWYRYSVRGGVCTKTFSFFSHRGRGGYSIRPTQNGGRESHPGSQITTLYDMGESRKGSRPENIALLNVNDDNCAKHEDKSNHMCETKLVNLKDTSDDYKGVDFSKTLTNGTNICPEIASKFKANSSETGKYNRHTPEISNEIISVQIEKSVYVMNSEECERNIRSKSDARELEINTDKDDFSYVDDDVKRSEKYMCQI